MEDLQQHLWVMKFEENILNTLSDLGFNTNAVLESPPPKKEYNKMMGTYLILQQQARKGCLSLAAPPQPSLWTLSLLHPQASEPTFGLFHTKPSQQHLLVVLTLPGQKVPRSTSMPPCRPQEKSTTCSYAT
ncbi:hypothetical protein A6R68_06219, partial [Neotoma lepida]